MRRRALVVAACLVAGAAALYCGAEERATQPPIEPAQTPIAAPNVPLVQLEPSHDLEPAPDQSRATPPTTTRARASVIAELRGIVRWPDGTPADMAIANVRSLIDDLAPTPFLIPLAVDPIAGGVLTGIDVRVDERTAEFRIERIAMPCFVAASARVGLDADSDVEPAPDFKSDVAKKRVRRQVRPLWSAAPVFVVDATRTVELVLRPAIALSGSVHDEAGALVDRFTLTAHQVIRLPNGERIEPSFPIADHQESFRRAAGKYAWNELGAGIWELVAEAPGLARTSVQRIELTELATVADFVMRQPAEISGTVIDANGKGCANQWVGVVYADAENWISSDAQCATDSSDDGSFRIERVKPGKLRLRTEPNYAAGPLPADWIELAPGEKRSGLRVVTSAR